MAMAPTAEAVKPSPSLGASVTGIHAIKHTSDDWMGQSHNGAGDEVYAVVWIGQRDRQGKTHVVRLKSSVFGQKTGPGRIQAGKASSQGGFVAGSRWSSNIGSALAGNGLHISTSSGPVFVLPVLWEDDGHPATIARMDTFFRNVIKYKKGLGTSKHKVLLHSGSDLGLNDMPIGWTAEAGHKYFGHVKMFTYSASSVPKNSRSVTFSSPHGNYKLTYKITHDFAHVCTSDRRCSDGRFCNGEEVCAPANKYSNGIGCIKGNMPCAAGKTCNEDLDKCEGKRVDADGDGHYAAPDGDDCDDRNPARFPGNTEICNGVDEDCNPRTFGKVDGDGDGYISAKCSNKSPGGRSFHGQDCDDTNAQVRPNSQVCHDRTHVKLCTKGVWQVVGCPRGQKCTSQPNGLGVCQPSRIRRPRRPGR